MPEEAVNFSGRGARAGGAIEQAGDGQTRRVIPPSGRATAKPAALCRHRFRGGRRGRGCDPRQRDNTEVQDLRLRGQFLIGEEDELGQ